MKPEELKDNLPNAHAKPAEAKPLPFDKPEQLRFVTGEKVEIIADCRTSGFVSVSSPPAKDAEDFICVVDECGLMLRTRIPIIRLATAAEMEAERPKVNIDLPPIITGSTQFYGDVFTMNFDGFAPRIDGNGGVVFERIVKGGGE